MPIPLSDALRTLVNESKSISLRFDRGYDGYDETKKWVHRAAVNDIPTGKATFLMTFVKAFNDAAAKDCHKEMLKRRKAVLHPLKPVSHTSTSPLIVGIGRWNPVETGFTFDRLTGSPFLPGSSVKGLLHAAAILIEKGDLEGGTAFWTDPNIKRIFGEQDQQGAFVFYDAYPETLPEMQVDVMTPHHSKYYGSKEPDAIAADWDEPGPVLFLRVKAGVPFLFWFGPRHPAAANSDDRDAIEKLLTTALDWLGAGAKTSSGYGWFESDAAANVPGSSARKADKPKEQRLEWQGAMLQWEPGTGTLYAIHGALKAYAKAKDLEAVVPAELLARIKDKKRKQQLTATVIVEEMGNDRKIVEVRVENA
jgi:CRISPR type III-B/RAMP module RAMP protein Cmr6